MKNKCSHTEDPTQIANIVNDFCFVNEDKKTVRNTNHDKLTFCQDKLPDDAKFVIPNIQKEKVLKFCQPLTQVNLLELIILSHVYTCCHIYGWRSHFHLQSQY